ncbi:chemotaxis protein CheW [Bacillus sp. S3]|uniref:chemotaxis protein CheW n=1 Tax=Bacillus sp. S3 TaxID=486398 RepID=UPI001189A7E6|nr:chemotaxis protein CheW [Bacillus sp. S3]QCJ42369.1 chemotaxis protein CheW [Bacillus sp. S3]
MNCKIVAFKLGDEEYGVDIQYVQSIEKLLTITRVPNSPMYVRGVINLRGNVIPIIDLRSKLNLSSEAFTEATRVIITKNEELEVGLIVDQISDVVDVLEESFEPCSVGDLQSEFFEGIAKTEGRLLILLKIEELLRTHVS